MKLGRRHNYHKGRAAIRHYANQPEPSDSIRFKLYTMMDNVDTSTGMLWSPGTKQWLFYCSMFLFMCSLPSYHSLINHYVWNDYSEIMLQQQHRHRMHIAHDTKDNWRIYYVHWIMYWFGSKLVVTLIGHKQQIHWVITYLTDPENRNTKLTNSSYQHTDTDCRQCRHRLFAGI